MLKFFFSEIISEHYAKLMDRDLKTYDHFSGGVYLGPKPIPGTVKSCLRA